MIFADQISDLLRKDNKDHVSVVTKEGVMVYYGTISGLVFGILIGEIGKEILDCKVLKSNTMTVAGEKEDEFTTFTCIAIDEKGGGL